MGTSVDNNLAVGHAIGCQRTCPAGSKTLTTWTLERIDGRLQEIGGTPGDALLFQLVLVYGAE